MTASDWRQAQRQALISLRDQISPADRAPMDAAIMLGLDSILAAQKPDCIAVYWPLRGEPDLRDWYRKIAESRAQLALPVVVARRQPLEFRPWNIPQPLVRDALNIPCPAKAAPVNPDLVVLPCVGFDPLGFRLGNGGGYYDRTLATLKGPLIVVGVAYERQLLTSIRPEAHDIPVDFVVTEGRVYSPHEKPSAK